MTGGRSVAWHLLRTHTFSAIFVILLTVTGCGDGTTTAVPSPDVTPARMLVSAGAGQLAEAHSPLPQAMIVRVTNAAGAGLQGLLVDWTYVAGHGHVLAETSTTDRDGRASVSAVMGARSAEERVRASLRGTSFSVEFVHEAAAPAVDVQIGYISRTPRLLGPTTDDAPQTAGWPAAGAPVQWVAHLFNGHPGLTAGGARYEWRDDGVVVDAGVVDLPPGETLLAMPWTWTFARHRLSLSIAPPDDVEWRDPSADDNTLDIWSDALTIGFQVERGVYDHVNCKTCLRFERRASEWIARWNGLLAAAHYPTSVPSGVQDRLRLDDVSVVPRGTPFPSTIDTDFHWRFNDLFVDSRFNKGSRFLNANSPASVVADQFIVLHELLHQRGLTDLYAYAVLHGFNGSFVGVRDNGALVVGTALMPLPLGATTVFTPRFNGIMGTQYDSTARLTEHSMYGLNARAHRRTPRRTDQSGNLLNLFAASAFYTALVPRDIALTPYEGSGLPLAGVEIAVFLDWVDGGNLTYTDTYRADPDTVVTTDETGAAVIPGSLLLRMPSLQGISKSWTVIVRARYKGRTSFRFIPGYEINLPYFRGKTERATVRF